MFASQVHKVDKYLTVLISTCLNFNPYIHTYYVNVCRETHLKHSHYACKYGKNFHPLTGSRRHSAKGRYKIWSQCCLKNNKRHVKHAAAKMFVLYLIREKKGNLSKLSTNHTNRYSVKINVVKSKGDSNLFKVFNTYLWLFFIKVGYSLVRQLLCTVHQS